MSEIKTEYRSVSITYQEFQDKWMAEDYTPKQTLALMKAAIDRKLDKEEKGKKFKAFEAIYSYNGWLKRVKVTSISEDGSVRTTDAKGEKEKHREFYRRYFFALDADSEAILKWYDEISAQITALDKSRMELTKKLKNLDFSEF